MVLELLLAVIAIALWMIVLKLRRLLPGSTRKVIEAETFVVRDQAGNVRAELGLRGGPLPALAIYEGNSSQRLVYLGEEGLAIHDSNGAHRIGLGLSGRHLAKLILKDGGGSRASAQLGLLGHVPALRLTGREDSPSIHVGFIRGDEFGFVLHDPQGKVIWRAPEASD
jgi:hypothetical protein